MATNSYNGAERRRFKRIKISLNVIYRRSEPPDVRIKTLDKETRAEMLDIGIGGMSIESDVDVPLHTTLWIKFTLSKAEKASVGFFGTVEVLGEVRNNAKLDSGKYRIGISFSKIDEYSKSQIANFVEQIEKGVKDPP
ncbi:MAG: PilZ domain-containing protein [Candidatus Omnitrophica bacterium]|nr:PilZ domain-containing protein [Candidatus Omnitrophota bacterium]